jgi:hypothetical protein
MQSDAEQTPASIHRPPVTSNLALAQKPAHHGRDKDSTQTKTNATPELNHASFDSDSRANSFVRNILPSSSYSSIFCPDFADSTPRNSFKARILQERSGIFFNPDQTAEIGKSQRATMPRRGSPEIIPCGNSLPIRTARVERTPSSASRPSLRLRQASQPDFLPMLANCADNV